MKRVLKILATVIVLSVFVYTIYFLYQKSQAKPVEFETVQAFKTEIIKHFKIKRRKVKYNSIGGNLIKGYSASQAYHESTHALFVASDSPLTSIDFFTNFFSIISFYKRT